MSFSIIHLSDIHIKDESDVILTRQNELERACTSSLTSNGVVVIVVSGDIAFSGDPKQYALAKKLLTELATYISEQKQSDVKIVCAPGNHDCVLVPESSIRKTLIDSVQLSKVDTEYYNQVSSVQANYRNFAESIGVNQIDILPQVEVSCDGNSVLFLLANTAWMSVLNEKPGKLIVPCNLYEHISLENYKAVFYVLHHPINWLDPDHKSILINHIRQNADIVLMGHEHARDSYEKRGDSFSVYCSHGKELQDSNSGESAFSVINFDSSFQTFDVIDFKWNGTMYVRMQQNQHQYHKNIAFRRSAVMPNDNILKEANDIGIVVNHFLKEEVSLPDLFVWPDLSKSDFRNEKNGNVIIRKNSIEELKQNSLSIVVGQSCSGKTAMAKSLFLSEEQTDFCCLYIKGAEFSFSDFSHIRDNIEDCFAAQYCRDCLEEFRQLPKEQKTVIVDDFDSIRNVKNRRNAILDYLCSNFGKVTIFLSSSLELATMLSSSTIGSLDHIIYYEILPLGNKKRHELISKWYNLNENTLTEEETNKRIEDATEKVNAFLGNGNAFMPALPVYIIGALQNIDAIQKSFSGSKFGFLYESLVQSSLSRIADNYLSSGNYEIDIGVMSNLAYFMLQEKRMVFTSEQLEQVVSSVEQKHLLKISHGNLLNRMINARIVCKDSNYGDVYRFMYPYVFYYFCGRYIAYNLDDAKVKETVDRMSSKLYNETYGNIIVFVCHFANNSDVVEAVLLNAYVTLDKYEPFSFSKTNPIFEEIKEAVDEYVPKLIASSDEEINKNKETRLSRLDEAGINDGKVTKSKEQIDDEITDQEKEMAAVVASFKTIEVLGEILQNYPTGVEGSNKIEIINEMHNLGMRSIQALINTMRLIESDLVDYLCERAAQNKKTIDKEKIVIATRRFIHLLISGMARGMVHQVALSLDSKNLLPAAQKSFENNEAISAKLVLLDLKMNCLHNFSFIEVQSLKKDLDEHNELFASRIVDSIVGYYLNYNSCSHSLRSQLCALCGLSQQQALIASQRNVLN